MKSKLLYLMLIGLVVANLAHATPDRTGKVDLGANVSAGFMEDADTALFVGGNASYGVSSNVGVGLSAGWAEFPSDLQSSDIGDLSAVPIFGDIYYRWQQEDRSFDPYAVLGLGAVIWDFDEEGLAAGSEVDIEPSFAVKLGGGVDWFLNENWILNFETAYVFANTEVEVENSAGRVTAEADADFWYVGGGVKFLFS